MNIKYFKLFTSLFALVMYSNMSFANMTQCPYGGGGPTSNMINFGNLNVDSNLNVGDVIATKNTGIGQIKTTPGSWNLYWKYTSGTPDAYKTVPTNIEGIGVRMSIADTGAYYPTQVTGHCKALIACMGPVPDGWDDQKVELVKTSNTVASGTLSSNVFAYAQCDNGQKLTNYSLANSTIISTTCDLEMSSLDVGLGDYKTSDFTSPGSTTDKKQFSVPVNCSGAGANFTLKVSSASIADQSNGVIALDPGGASGLGIQLLQSDGVTPAPLNGTEWSAGTSSSGENNITLYARYYQLDSNVTSGAANATATLTFNYK